MTTWRLLDDGITEPYHHFAVEEAIARTLDEGHSPPTLRLRRIRRAVSVGVSQDTWAEVSVSYCRESAIGIVRRMNGGGAVYHDVDSFCYSAFFQRPAFPQPDHELFNLFARPVLRTCSDYGLTAAITGRNDVSVGNRKVYGSAQMAWYAAFVQSGTLLVDTDFETMWRALKPSALKFADKSAKTILDRVTSLSRELGSSVSVVDAMSRFARHFSTELGITLQPGELTSEERALSDELWQQKYSADSWNLGERRSFGLREASKTPLGIVTLALELDGNVIRSAEVGGDLLLTDGGAALGRLSSVLAGKDLAEASMRAEQFDGAPEPVRYTVARLLEKLNAEWETGAVLR